jgi:hypothetical protein
MDGEQEQMRNKTVYCLLILLTVLSPAAFAEDFPTPTDENEFKKGFSEETGVSKADQESILKDKLEIGGSLYTDMISSMYIHQRFKNSTFVNPNLLWVYMDGKFPMDVRAFVKGRVLYDPTLDETKVSPITGLTNQKTQTALDEAKIMFNANNKVFFTVGKQKVKYGSARIWNPTDFINTTMKDPFYTYDRRQGVTLVKTHIPINNSNLYLIAALDNASSLDKIGYYLRYELPFTSSEFAISMLARSNTSTKLGLDLSTAFMGADLYVETSIAKGSDKTLYTASPYVPGLYNAYTDRGSYYNKTTAGISYDLYYGNNDTMTFNAEYFYNGEGYSDPNVYLTLFYNQALNIFNLGRHYAMLMFYLPKPGTWNTYTFMVLNISNISDRTSITRFQAMKQLTNALAIGFNITGHYGKPNGEFKISNQMLDLGFRLELVF